MDFQREYQIWGADFRFVIHNTPPFFREIEDLPKLCFTLEQENSGAEILVYVYSDKIVPQNFYYTDKVRLRGKWEEISVAYTPTEVYEEFLKHIEVFRQDFELNGEVGNCLFIETVPHRLQSELMMMTFDTDRQSSVRLETFRDNQGNLVPNLIVFLTPQLTFRCCAEQGSCQSVAGITGWMDFNGKQTFFYVIHSSLHNIDARVDKSSIQRRFYELVSESGLVNPVPTLKFGHAPVLDLDGLI